MEMEMKQKGSIICVFGWTLIWVFVGAAVIAGLLGYFNIIGSLPDKWEVNFPPGYSNYEIKEMPKVDSSIDVKNHFNDLKIFDEKKNCFFDIKVSDRQLAIKIWTMSKGIVYFTEKSLEAPLTDKIDRIDVETNPPETNKLDGLVKLVIWLN